MLRIRNLVCLLVFLAIGGVMAPTANASLYDDALTWHEAAVAFLGQVDAAKAAAVEKIAFAKGLADYAYDRTAGDVLIAEAEEHVEDGDVDRLFGISRINNGIAHFNAFPTKELQEAIDDYSFGMVWNLTPAKVDFDAATAHAEAAIATFWTTEEIALGYALIASSGWFTVLDETYGAKIIGWGDYECTALAREDCEDPTNLANGDTEMMDHARPALTYADDEMDEAAYLCVVGDGYYALEDWLYAAVYYDRAYERIAHAEGEYYHGGFHAIQALGLYFPE